MTPKKTKTIVIERVSDLYFLTLR